MAFLVVLRGVVVPELDQDEVFSPGQAPFDLS
jgi:hypothetical protein